MARPLAPASRRMGGGRGGAGPAVSLARGFLRRRHRPLLHGRARADLVGNAWACRHRHCRCDIGASSCHRFHAGAWICGHGRRAGGPDTRNGAHCASGAALSGIKRRHHRICRSARGARAQRPHRRAGTARRCAPHRRDAGARASCRAQGHGAGRRQLCRAEGTPDAAFAAATPRRLRLRPRHVFPAASARRVTRSAPSSPRQRPPRRACGCVTRRSSTASARRSTSACAPSSRATKARSVRR